MFHAKYGSLVLYDEYLKKIFIIDLKILYLNKTDEWTLIGIPEKEYETLSDHEYFCIHDDLYDIIKSNHQDRISCRGLYQMIQMKMNLIVKQQIYTTTISKRGRA